MKINKINSRNFRVINFLRQPVAGAKKCSIKIADGFDPQDMTTEKKYKEIPTNSF